MLVFTNATDWSCIEMRVLGKFGHINKLGLENAWNIDKFESAFFLNYIKFPAMNHFFKGFVGC